MNDQVYINLLDKCKSGNRMAQTELYRHLSKPVFNTCMRIVRDRETAEDLMQETFIKVFNGLERFEGRSQLTTWIKRIAINQSLNELKKRKVELVEMQDWTVPVNGEVEEEPQYDIALVKKLMNKLPEGYRVVMTLYLIEGYQHDEIAQIMGISEVTSRSQYARAKKKLRDLYVQVNN